MIRDPNVQAGLQALQDGDKREARRHFGIAVKENLDNHVAWWYLATILTDNEQKIHCLRQVVRLKPNHTEAKEMLSQIQRQTATPTPPEGISRPVLEGAERGDGTVTMYDPVPTVAGLPPVQPPSLPADQPPNSEDEQSNKDVITLVAVSLVSLLAIIGAVILVFTGIAPELVGGTSPELESTLQPVVFEVPACNITPNQTRLIFINNTGVTLTVREGREGGERDLFVLDDEGQQSVDVIGGVITRYEAVPQANHLASSGANIEVPDGNTCRVPIGLGGS